MIDLNGLLPKGKDEVEQAKALIMLLTIKHQCLPEIKWDRNVAEIKFPLQMKLGIEDGEAKDR